MAFSLSHFNIIYRKIIELESMFKKIYIVKEHAFFQYLHLVSDKKTAFV